MAFAGTNVTSCQLLPFNLLAPDDLVLGVTALTSIVQASKFLDDSVNLEIS
jgi:hypothetical protein